MKRPFFYSFYRERPVVFNGLQDRQIVYSCRQIHQYTGRFIVFSVITKIYNNKAKGPILTEFFHSHMKTIFFFYK
jgi:hypothetical protein